MTGFPIADDGIFLTKYMSTSFLKENFPGYSIAHENPMLYKFDSLDFNQGVELRENQINTMHKLENCNHNEIYLNVPTAIGKTFMGTFYSVYLQTKAIVMCKSVGILDQWEETIDTITVGGSQRILRLKGNKDIENILSGKTNCYNYDFFLFTPSTMAAFTKKHSWEEFSNAIKETKASLTIIDEAHLNIGATVRLNASTNAYRTLYLSADDRRGNYEAKKAFDEVFRNTVFIRMDEDEMIQLKHIIAVFVVYDSDPNAGDLTQIQGGSYNWSHLQYSKYQFRKGITQAKTIFIINEILKATDNHPYYKILVLLQTIDQIETLADELQELYKGKLTVGKYHSKMNKEGKQATLKCDVIVSTYGSFSTGINVVDPEIQYVISTIPVDEVTTNQAGGRCRPIQGKYSWLFMLYDIGFAYCETKMNRVAGYLKSSKIKDMFKRDLGPVNTNKKVDDKIENF